MNKITKDTIINDVLKMKLSSSFVFMKHGMGCSGCPHSKEETIEVGAKLHNVDVDKLIEDLNKIIQ